MKTILNLLLFLTWTYNYSVNNLILVGPPGSGKGTFSNYMCENKKYKHICVGDILRTHVKNQTEIGKLIEPILKKGDYIDDSITYKIIREEINNCVNNNISFILDAFPRNKETFDFAINLFKELKIQKQISFVHFNSDDKTCIQRICDRLVCFNCYSVFNRSTLKPEINLSCLKCNHKLEHRLGDTIENSIKRIKYYRDFIEPLLFTAKELKYKIIEIDSNQPIEVCLSLYKNTELN